MHVRKLRARDEEIGKQEAGAQPSCTSIFSSHSFRRVVIHSSSAYGYGCRAYIWLPWKTAFLLCFGAALKRSATPLGSGAARYQYHGSAIVLHACAPAPVTVMMRTWESGAEALGVLRRGDRPAGNPTCASAGPPFSPGENATATLDSIVWSGAPPGAHPFPFTHQFARSRGLAICFLPLFFFIYRQAFPGCSAVVPRQGRARASGLRALALLLLQV